MSLLPEDAIRRLLEPFVSSFDPGFRATALSSPVIGQVSTYLGLLVRWNARVSLTAIRDPEEIIQRHFGESFFTAGHLSTRLAPNAELLDYGSGPGFPGLPIQIAAPDLRVTVAESQARKVAFLREVIRTLELPAEVWPARVEEMKPECRFDAVTVRAVEKMAFSISDAQKRLRPGGWLFALVGSGVDLPNAESVPIPGAKSRRLLLWQNVPRGTFLAPAQS